MPLPATCIGIDVGGTRIRAARVDGAGRMQDRREEAVCRGRAEFLAQVTRMVAALRERDCTAIGIGIPGRVDAPAGVVVSAGYLDIAGLALAADLVRATGLPVRVENDATMALLAEARGVPGVVAMLTIGTGIGGAVAVDGAPWYGGGFSGQFGHLAVDADGPPCNCGRRGCVETLSSGTALGRLIGVAGLPTGTRAEALLDRAAAGDGTAASILDAWAQPCQRAVQTLVAAIDPARVVIGGGLGAAMCRAMARLPEVPGWFALPVVPARLGDDAGVIGAGLAAARAASASAAERRE